MRLTRPLLALVAGLSFLGSTSSASADGRNAGPSAAASGRTIDVSASILGGRYRGDGGGGGGANCQWTPAPTFINNGLDLQPTATPVTRVVGGITEREYLGGCVGGTIGSIWVPQITAAAILPDLYDAMQRQLEDPQVVFDDLDPEFGWAYVTVPFGITVGNTGTISVTARVSAGPLFVWATMTATPSQIVFEPGEPGGAAVSCAAAAGRCEYVYDNSSAIADDGFSFVTSTSMTYDISYRSSSGGGSYPSVTTSSSAALAVAEVQALVTCTGSRPEQGGC